MLSKRNNRVETL